MRPFAGAVALAAVGLESLDPTVHVGEALVWGHGAHWPPSFVV